MLPGELRFENEKSMTLRSMIEENVALLLDGYP